MFTETLELAVRAELPSTAFSAVAPPGKTASRFTRKAEAKAFEDWLNDQGVINIQNVNKSLEGAHSWFPKVGVTAADLALV